MSDYEIHKGALKKTNLTKEKLVKEYLTNYSNTNNRILKDKEAMLKNEITNETINEYFLDSIDDFIELDNIVYEIIDNQFDDEDLYEMSKKNDNTYEYLVRFYNGGCGFEEALETAFSKINKAKN